jgi:hypothetical protein
MILNLVLEVLPEGILVATVSGHITLQGAVERFQEIFSFAAQNNIGKILYNSLDAAGELSTSDRYQLATGVVTYMRSLGMGNPAVALVGKPPLVTGFGLQVAQNMGALALIFADNESALRWLRSPRLNNW